MAFNPVDPRTWGGGVKAVGRAVQGVGRSTGRAAAAVGRGAVAVNPFDPRNTNRAGEALGNFISRSKRAEGIVNAVGQRGGERAARIIRDASGVRNYQEAARDFGKGNVVGGLFNLGEGALDTVSTALGYGAGKAAYQAARQAGKRVLPSVARGVATGTFRDPLGTRLVGKAARKSLPTRLGAYTISALIPGSLVGKGIERGIDPYGKAADYLSRLTDRISGQPQGPSTSGRTADQWERILGRGGASGAGGPSTSGRTADQWERILGGGGTLTTPGGGGIPATEDAATTPAAPAAPADGGAFTVPGQDLGAGMFGQLPYEDGMTVLSGMRQGAGGAGGPGGYSQELAALSPEEMQQLLEASREAQREYDEIINQIGRTTAETERDFFDYTRGVNRQVAGGRQNVASQLAQLGLDTSPAPQAYADYLGAQGQRQIATGRGRVADILADLRGQRGKAEANKLRRLRELDMAMQNARARRTVNRVQY